MARTTSVEQFEGPSFLMQGLLEAGIFAFLTGAPGGTKTLLALEIAARLTRGKAPGDFSDKPINVIYVSVEGSFKRSIGPRFTAAGGDFTRFHYVNDVIWLPSNLARLEDVIKTTEAKLVIIDPIKDHLDPSVYSSPLQTTHALRQIHALAERRGCTILGIDWPSKSSRKGDLTVSGNQAFTGVPRQVLVVGRLAQDEWVCGVSKANDSAALTGWIYDVETHGIGTNARKKALTSRRVVWKREAKPVDVLRAREQVQLSEDIHLLPLLQFMAPAEGKESQPFETAVLIDWLNHIRLLGKTKARKLLSATGDAGYTVYRKTGAGAGYKVTWTITALGQAKLDMDKNAIEGVFPSMDPQPLPEAQLALGSGAPVNGTRQRPSRRKVNNDV